MKKKTIRRWIWGVAGSLLLLLLLLQATFLLFGDEILKKSILLGFQQYSQQAFEPSRQPVLNFDNLSLNIITGNFSVEGLHFAGYLPSEHGSGDYISFTVPQANVAGLELLDLYREKRVRLESINFFEPDIQLLKTEKADSLRMDPQESIRASTLSLQRLIIPYLRSFSFDQLNINDGNLFVSYPGEANTSSNRFHSEHVYINLNDFLVDSMSMQQTDRIFFTRDFDIRLGDYQVLAPDSAFLLRLDTLGYSSRDEKIYLKNLRTYPLLKDSQKTNFKLSVPQVSLTEVSWKEIYFDSLFHAQQLIVSEPMLSLSMAYSSDTLQKKDKFGLKSLSVANLYPLLQDKIKGLQINELLLEKGRLHLERTGRDTLDLLSIHDIGVLLSGIRVDSGAQETDSLSRIFPADTAIMDLEDIRLFLPDRQHYLTVSRAHLSTSRQQGFVCDVLLDSLNFKPGYDSLEQLLFLTPPNPLAFEVFVPQVRLDGIQLEAFNQHRAAVLDSIYIRSPDIRIANFGLLSLGKRASGLSESILDTLKTQETVKSILYDWSHARLNLSPFIAPGDSSAFLQWLNASKLQLDSGMLQVVRADTQQYAFVPVTTVDTFYTFLDNIKIDHLPDDSLIISDEGRVAVRADEVDVFIKEGEFVLPGEGGAGGTLRVADGRASTLDKEVYFRRVYYWTSPGFPPNTDFWLHQMYIPYVQLKEIDLQKLYQEQIAEAQSFSAWSPRFTFNYRKSGIERTEISFDFVNLYPQFSSYLDRVTLGGVSINNADLTVRKVSRSQIDSLFVTDKLNVALSGFYIDSLSRMTRMRPFYARALNLEMENYRWNFLSEDPAHQLQGMAGTSLHYNSYEGQLDAQGLEVLVNTESDKYLEKLELKSEKIMADDLDPYRLIKDRNLNIGRLIVQEPFFSLEEMEGRRVSKPSADGQWESLQPDMNQLLSNNLKGIELRFVHVEHGRLSYLKRSTSDTLNVVRLDSVDFLARNIRVDGSRERHLHHILYADDVDYSLVSGELLFNQPGKQKIQIDKAGLSSRDSRMSLQGISVKPTTELESNATLTHIDAELEQLTFSGLDLNRAYLYGDLNIQRVFLREAKLNVFFGKPSDATTRQTPSMKELLSPYIRTIEVSQLQFPRGALALYHKDDRGKIFESRRLAATISGFSLNQELLGKPATVAGKVFYADDINLNIKDFSQKTKDGMYRLVADEIDVGTASRKLNIVNLQMQPLLNRQEALNRFDRAHSLATLQTDQILLEGLDFDRLLNQREVHANRLGVINPTLELFRDKRLPHDESRRPPLHQKMLFQLDQTIDIGEVYIRDGLISYAERTPDAEQDGVITFEDVNAQIRNVSNRQLPNQDQKKMQMEVDALVMGEGQLNAFLEFPADTSSMDFAVRGTLGPMELMHFNRILEPAAFVHIKEGVNQNLQFSFSGNEHKTTGSMEFRYNDLSVLMIDKEKGQAGFDEKLGSFIANAFVLKANNPKSVFLRIGNIAYERDPSRAMFHYWWKSILSGVKSSIGLEKSTEKTKDFIRADGG